VDLFKAEYENYKKYLTPEGVCELDKQGFGVVDLDGDLVTPLVQNEECAYASFDKDCNCFCATELAYCKGESKFRKPISCALYPIRLSTFSNGTIALNLHRWQICKCAFEKGKKKRFSYINFYENQLSDVLVRSFTRH
jgi:Protein of unknown function (DUF3109).